MHETRVELERIKSSRRTTQPSLGTCRLEELDGIAGRIVKKNLLSSDAVDDLVPKMNARGAQSSDDGLEVVDLDRKTIPPARLRSRAIWHRLTTASLGVGRTEHEPQLAARQHCKHRRRVHLEMETEMCRVERDRGVDVAHDVSNLNAGHGNDRVRVLSIDVQFLQEPYRLVDALEQAPDWTAEVHPLQSSAIPHTAPIINCQLRCFSARSTAGRVAVHVRAAAASQPVRRPGSDH